MHIVYTAQPQRVHLYLTEGGLPMLLVGVTLTLRISIHELGLSHSLFLKVNNIKVAKGSFHLCLYVLSLCLHSLNHNYTTK